MKFHQNSPQFFIALNFNEISVNFSEISLTVFSRVVLSRVLLHVKKFVAFPHKPFNFLCYPWEALLYSKPFNRNKL